MDNTLNRIDIWSLLQEDAHHIKSLTLNSQLAQESFSCISACGITLNYGHQKISQQSIQKLILLANHVELKSKINQLFQGVCVNMSENKPALHTALRAPLNDAIWVNNENIISKVNDARDQIATISNRIREKQWIGFSGEPITDIVNIGIGGSDLGPRFCMRAFSDLIHPELGFHFISDADPCAFSATVKHLKPETTLFIVASKSFTTHETLYNARKAKAWIGEDRINKHFIAVTANLEKAASFGIETTIPIWDWVGGRYSFCSAINLITAIAIGNDQFAEVLAGANSMDNHFKSADLTVNLPVLLALLGVWNNNFLEINNVLMLTYSQYLDQFVAYIQQLDMESNGKSINNQGQSVDYATGPIVWGGAGNQAQHSYYQLLCQGTHKVAVDLITINSFNDEMMNHMCFDKIRVLSQGVQNTSEPGHLVHGGIPLNHICLHDHSPFTIGALIALYEHKIYTQSVIWDINPFDQPGVESAKKDRIVCSC